MGRGARYGLGFAVSGFLALAGLACLLVAGALALGTTMGDSFRDDSTGRADAVVTSVDDVDVYVRYDDVEFGDTHETWVDWPASKADPEIGDSLTVAYDPDYPDDGVYLAEDVDAWNAAGSQGPPDDVVVLSLVGAGVFGVALVGAIATPFWARRVPPRPRPAPAWPAPHPYAYPPPPPAYGSPYQPPAFPQYPPPQQQQAPAPEQPRPPEPPTSPWNLPG